MKKYFVVLLCSVLLFSAVWPVSAAPALSAKQLMVQRLKNYEPSFDNTVFLTALGAMEMEIKTLSGELIPPVQQVQALPGSKLKVDYKLDTPETKLGADYTIEYDKGKYSGELYLDGDRFIASTGGILSLVEKLGLEIPPGEKPPHYVYAHLPELSQMWQDINDNKGQSVPPAFKDLMVFLLEAVPDKYFTLSLTGQKIIFEIDNDGLLEIIYACRDKIEREPERFAALCAEIASHYDPTLNSEEMIKEMLAGMAADKPGDQLAGNPEEPGQGLEPPVSLTKFRCEFSLLPARENKITAVVDLKDETATGQISFDMSHTGGKDGARGNYALNFRLKGTENGQFINGQLITGQMQMQYEQSAKNAASSGSISVLAEEEGKTLLNLELLLRSEDKADPKVKVGIPALTDENSINLDEASPYPLPGQQTYDFEPEDFETQDFLYEAPPDANNFI